MYICIIDNQYILSAYYYLHPEALSLVLATVLDHHFGSGSGSEPNQCQIGGLGCKYTRTIHSGTVQQNTPYPSALGRYSAGCPVGPSVNTYNVLAFAV